MPSPLIRDLQVVGLYFRDADTKNLVRGLVGSTRPAMFEREPANEHDPHAVKVLLMDTANQWHHVGYVPASVSALVTLWLAVPEPFSCSVALVADKQLPKVLLSVVTP